MYIAIHWELAVQLQWNGLALSEIQLQWNGLALSEIQLLIHSKVEVRDENDQNSCKSTQHAVTGTLYQNESETTNKQEH